MLSDSGKQGVAIMYSHKCSWELILAVGSQIDIKKIFSDLSLAVWFGIAICMIVYDYVSKKL